MGIFKKGSKVYSIFNFKCPRCHEGDLYKTGTWEFKKSFEMHDSCEHCSQTFMPEPGFYYGAMFLSYIMMGWFCLGFAGLLVAVAGWSVNSAFLVLVIVCALLLVWVFRFSRALWINFNVHFDPKYKGQKG
ncbi:MAG: DUF983 domain-containing protein [Bacteroidota bacterium]